MVTLPATTPPTASWAEQEVDELAARPAADAEWLLSTDFRHGLPAHEAASRLGLIGPNDPAPVGRPSWPRVLARQFINKLIVLLMLATAATLLLGEFLNAVAIAITVLVSAVFGFINEYRSERAIAALRRLTARQAEVVRDGLHEDVPASALVPGDLLVLSEGDVVAADARLIDGRGLRVNEAMLTGEPEAVAKSVDAILDGESVAAPTMVYAGTTVAAGSGVAVVAATGRRTKLGSIAAAVEGAGRRVTPLEARLDQLGNRLVLLFLALCALVVAIGLVRGLDATLVIMMAVSLAIGAVPEGLPAVATTTLALAFRRLAARGVLVRRLDAVETLGSTSVIVTDKTGTLTEGRMVVRHRPQR
jgi:P-type Ca2+ transporter type 2C